MQKLHVWEGGREVIKCPHNISMRAARSNGKKSPTDHALKGPKGDGEQGIGIGIGIGRKKVCLSLKISTLLLKV